MLCKASRDIRHYNVLLGHYTGFENVGSTIAISNRADPVWHTRKLAS